MAIHAQTDVTLNTIPAYTSLLGGHFVYYQGDATTVASANVVQNAVSNPANWGYNSHIGSNGIQLRYGTSILSEWTSLWLKFYNPTTNTPNAILDSNGLVTSKGGVKAGVSRTDNFVYLSSDNFNDPISGHNNGTIALDNYVNTDWREIIGTKFGVRADGTLYASNVKIDGDITAQSLTINGENRDYNGIAALNITAYQIEIRKNYSHASITDPDTQVYLYPLLYHNGDLDTSVVYSRYVWYKDNSASGIPGSSTDGGILALYGHTYRVEYDFDDGAVEEGTDIQVREVDPSKYITQISDAGIMIHPEVTLNTTVIQLDATGLDIVKDGISVAKYGEIARVGRIANGYTRAEVGSSGLDIINRANNVDNSVALFSNTARIGQADSSRFLMKANSLEAYNSQNQKYFEASIEGIVYGNNTVANTTQVKDASKVATNYLTNITGTNGISVHDLNDLNNYVNINSNGMDVVKTNSVAFFGEACRVGDSSKSHLTLDFHSLKLKDKEGDTYFHVSDLRDASGITTILEHWEISDTLDFYLSVPAVNTNYTVEVTDYSTWDDHTVRKYTDRVELVSWPEPIYNWQTGTTWPKITVTYDTASPMAKAYTLGKRDTEAIVGMYSFAAGYNTAAIGIASHTEGKNTVANGDFCHAEGLNTLAKYNGAHSEGVNTEARYTGAHAEGSGSFALGEGAHASGVDTYASGYGAHSCGVGTRCNGGFVAGSYNDDEAGDFIFEVGNGTGPNYGDRSNALRLDGSGNLTIAGRLTQSSDRRIKEHINYLGNDAIEFIQGLKPAHFKKEEEDHVGFYAQEVEEVDKWNCMTGEINHLKTLSYSEIIAPLVAYCQHLENRIKQLEEKE